jgi:putative tryptophan/tyrosine transport system substrate-binding protein
MLRVLCFVAMSVFLASVQVVYSTDKTPKKVAIFDYDYRGTANKTMAKFLEEKLRAQDPTIKITQYDAVESDAIAKVMLTEMDKKGFDLILTITTEGLTLGKKYITKTPFLFTNANNPQFLVYSIKNSAAQGGNFSGISYWLPPSAQLRFFREIQPSIKRMGVIHDTTALGSEFEKSEITSAAAALGINLTWKAISNSNQLTKVTAELVAGGVDSILTSTSDKIYNNYVTITAVTASVKIPVYSLCPFNTVKNGAIAHFDADYYLVAERILIPMAKRVLYDGVNPGTMPIGYMDKNAPLSDTIFILNKTSAKAVGITIPAAIVEKASMIF